MISNQSLSFEQIKSDLITYVQSKPDNQKWKDFTATGVGTTVVELLASIGAYNSFNSLVQRREGYLGAAMYPSSVEELAFNRGYMQPPSKAGELEISILPYTSFMVGVGEVIGSYGNYQLVSKETKNLVGNSPNTIIALIGDLHQDFIDISGMSSFEKYSFGGQDSYIAEQLEELKIDGGVIQLKSDLGTASVDSTQFMLRRVKNGKSEIYSGNGIVGYCKPAASRVEYRYLTYGQVFSDLNVNFYPDAVVVSYKFISLPVYGLSTDELRAVALYYPLDGRISNDRDYESVVLKYFGGAILSVYSKNDSYQQWVYLLSDLPLSETIIEGVYDLIEGRRQQGIKINVTPLLKSNGTEVAFNFALPAGVVSSKLIEIVTYLEATYGNRIFRSSTVLDSVNIAVELSAIYGMDILPSDRSQVYTIPQVGYISNLVVNFT